MKSRQNKNNNKNKKNNNNNDKCQREPHVRRVEDDEGMGMRRMSMIKDQRVI